MATYFDSLPPADRATAHEWATMPPDEFHARIGPVVTKTAKDVDTIKDDVTTIKAQMDDIKAQVADLRTPFWRQAAGRTGLLSIGGAIATIVRAVIDNPSAFHPR